MKKKTLFKVCSCTLLVVLMLSLVAPVIPARADNIEKFYWENIIMELNLDTGELVMKGEGSTPVILTTVVQLGHEILPWWNYREYVKTARVDEGITWIGDAWFNGLPNLKSIHLSSTVTSFAIPWDINNLESYTVHPDNQYYSALDGVLYNKDRTELISAPGATSGHFVVPDFVTDIGAKAFYYCKNLTEVTLPDGLINIWDYAFGNLDQLTSIYIPDSVERIGCCAFEHCDNLASIRMGENVKRIATGAFRSLPKLTHIELPKALERIDMWAFQYCSNLKSMVIYSNLDCLIFTAYSDCENFTDVYYIGTEEEFNELVYNDHLPKDNFRYGISGTLDNGIEWDLDSNKKKLVLDGSGTLTGKEPIWKKYKEYYSKVYVAKGISGAENGIGNDLTHCGTKSIAGVEYNVYAKSNTITFDAKGGTGAPTPIKQIHGEKLTIPVEKPVRDGYVFMGWCKEKYADEVDYTPGAQIESYQNTTLYAVWEERAAISISVVTGPDKTVYQLGEPLVPDGLIIRAHYNDGTWVDMDGDCVLSGFNAQVAGEQKIIVTYNGLKTSFTATVLPEAAKLVGIEPVISKTEYTVGDTFEEGSISVKLLFGDGTEQIITEGFRIEGFCSDAAGAVQLTVFYEDCSAVCDISIEAPEDIPDAGTNPEEHQKPTTGVPQATDATEAESRNEVLKEPATELAMFVVAACAAAVVIVLVVLLIIKKKN